MRSILGMLPPIMPRWWALRFHMPTSCAYAEDSCHDSFSHYRLAQHSLLQIIGGRLGAQPDREDRIREPLPREDPQLLVPGGERRAFARQIGERQRAAFLHLGNEREHLVERRLLGGLALRVRLETFLKRFDELRLRQVAQEMDADGLRLVGREDRARVLGGRFEVEPAHVDLEHGLFPEAQPVELQRFLAGLERVVQRRARQLAGQGDGAERRNRRPDQCGGKTQYSHDGSLHVLVSSLIVIWFRAAPWAASARRAGGEYGGPPR